MLCSTSCSRFDIPMARAWSLSLGAGPPRRARRINRKPNPRRRPFRLAKIAGGRPARAADFLLSDFRCGPIDGALAVELVAATGSPHIGASRQRTGWAALSHARRRQEWARIHLSRTPTRAGHLDTQYIRRWPVGTLARTFVRCAGIVPVTAKISTPRRPSRTRKAAPLTKAVR